MHEKIELLPETPSQTAGPYLHLGFLPPPKSFAINRMARPGALGKHIRVEGRVLDGTSNPIGDAVLEFWQADANGHYPQVAGRVNAAFDPNLCALGRAQTELESGKWWIETVLPGPTPSTNAHLHAPHLTIFIFARGITIHLHTRMYFGDRLAANAADPVLTALATDSLRNTLIARANTQDRQTVYHFDIHLQGDRETVFFDA